MTNNSSATRRTDAPIPQGSWRGPAWGLLGVLGFSFTVPLTRHAVEGLSPLFIGSGRAVVAALLAVAALSLTRQRLPGGRQWARLAVVAGGVVVGFPLLTSYALADAPASHGAMVIGLLPAATAVCAVLRGRERPPPAFWLASGLGAVAAVGFAAVAGGTAGRLAASDLLLFGAVVAAAVGYAEGGLLARELGAWQTVSWALVLSAPVMAVLALLAAADRTPTGTASQWAAFGYLGVVSMFLAFIAWYRGLAVGPITRVSQVQLTQPVLSIGWAALLLGEQVGWATVVGGAAVVLLAGVAVRRRAAAVVTPVPVRGVPAVAARPAGT